MTTRTSIAVLLALLAAGCSKDSAKQNVQAAAKPAEPVAVRTAAAELRTVDKSISVTGSLHPDESVNVSSEVPGRISSIHVDFGHFVRKGQVVAELDKQELTLQVERSKASLAQALARLGLDPGDVNARPESTPAIRQAIAQMEDAKSKFINAQQLYKTGDISRGRYIEVEKAFKAHEEAVELAKDEMRTQWASVSALKADLGLAQKRLSDATIRAPFDGAVSARLASPGQYMKENTPILTIVKTWPLRLRVEVPETASGAVRAGTELSFTTDAAPGNQFSAIVREINPSLDPKARSLTVEARLSKPDKRLLPGMFVQVQLVTVRNNEVVAVPKQAIYNVAGLTKLFVIRDGKAYEKKITPGLDLGSHIEVPRDQVSPGDQVAISALTQLIEGLPVRATATGNKS